MKTSVLAILIGVSFAGAALGAEADKAGGAPAPPPKSSADSDPNPAHLRTAFSARVISPDLIICTNVGRVRLIGVHSPGPADPGYQKALLATQKYALQKSVKLDVCAAREKDDSGATRARVYFMEKGRGHNLNTKLLRAGLASAVKENPCHISFDSWPALVQQARAEKRGLFGMNIEMPDEFVPPATPGAAPPGDTPPPPASGEKKNG